MAYYTAEEKAKMLAIQLLTYAQCPTDGKFPLFNDCFSRLYEILRVVKNSKDCRYDAPKIASSCLYLLTDTNNRTKAKCSRILPLSIKQALCIAYAYLGVSKWKIPYWNNYFPPLSPKAENETDKAAKFFGGCYVYQKKQDKNIAADGMERIYF